MREILFRGKHNGEWVEGYLLFDEENNRAYIAQHFEDEAAYIRKVVPETVGQYTGLTDKNGKKIFEGDIIEFEDMLGIINFSFGCYCVKTNKPDWKARNNPAIDIIFNEYPNAIKVIGNIHDNPELLKGE